MIFKNSLKRQPRTRQLIWSTAPPSRRRLVRDGFQVLDYQWIKRRVTASRTGGAARSSLGNPAASLLAVFRRQAKVAVLGVPCSEIEDLQLIYGYVVEPAFRWGCLLLVGADRELTALARLPDPEWRYQWTVERLQYLAHRARSPCRVVVAVPVSRWQRIRAWLSSRGDAGRKQSGASGLDAEQVAAVQAGDGVVQVIAPAGSGKTTVLIERVKELQRRGTPASGILCLSFNRAAKVEIGVRLARAGIEGVVVRSFHGMGLAILKAAGRLRTEIGAVGDVELKGMLGEAAAAEVVDGAVALESRLDVATVRGVISGFKLEAMIRPDEALRRAASGDLHGRICARVYAMYERELARIEMLDFDDLVANAVTLLQTDAAVRARWQKRFERVLVDEYQDIEPSQALLVGILAAPQDSLFCVGDEDQCIYAWRRATVQRIIELDQVYPGLERHALIRNYRCGRRITEASRRLIQHNRIRFAKPLHAGAKQAGDIVVAACESRTVGAQLVAELISDAVPNEVVVLARTAKLLAEVDAACADRTEAPSGVELATIHGAKGREWDRVILYGVDEGQTPHRQAATEAGLEDERRLFYVALTRAKQRLEIICTVGRESRFLREAGVL